jgi:sporulation protein YlmC with PRC-barrel domain
MRTRTFVSGLLAAALLSTTAVAQTNAPATAPSATTTTVTKIHHWRSSKLIGVNIYNEKNEKLGDINEILLDPAGKVIGYVVGVGGFLGMGEHDILVEPSKIKFMSEPVRTTATTTDKKTADKKTTDAAPTNTRPVSNTSGAARAANEQWYPDHGVMNASKDELKQMKEFKYSTYN